MKRLLNRIFILAILLLSLRGLFYIIMMPLKTMLCLIVLTVAARVAFEAMFAFCFLCGQVFKRKSRIVDNEIPAGTPIIVEGNTARVAVDGRGVTHFVYYDTK